VPGIVSASQRDHRTSK